MNHFFDDAIRDHWLNHTEEGRIFKQYRDALHRGDGSFISERSLEHNIVRLRIFAGNAHRWADELAAVEQKSLDNAELVATVRGGANQYAAWATKWQGYVDCRDRWLRRAAVVLSAVILTSPLWVAWLVLWGLQ